MRMLLIDNYDSFTYNLVQAFAALGAEVIVHRNDAISVDEALAIAPTHLVISPGPGRPEDAGVSGQAQPRGSRVGRGRRSGESCWRTVPMR